jgi:putrescine transport system ATP-binding protein
MSKITKKPLVSIKNISKQFEDGHVAVDSVNLDIFPKEFFSLLGGSGSGKSTLLRMLAGFEQPTDGKIIIDGVDMANIPPYKRPVNMMFQSYALFPHMSVKQNIMFGLKQEKSLNKSDIEKSTDRALGIINMTEWANRKPHQLSGGQ